MGAVGGERGVGAAGIMGCSVSKGTVGGRGVCGVRGASRGCKGHWGCWASGAVVVVWGV